MIIAVDFDGTCVTNEFPNIGQDIGAAPVLRGLVDSGHKLILYTMRSDKTEVSTTDSTILGVAGPFLTAAVKWFADNNIPLWGINENPEQKNWTDSPKVYANLYIDDCALGCPLRKIRGLKKPVVDWDKLEDMLIDLNILSVFTTAVEPREDNARITIRFNKHG